MKAKLMTQKLIAGLDVVCASYLPPTQMPEIKKIEIIACNGETLEEHNKFDNFHFVGIDLDYRFALYLSNGKLETERGLTTNCMRFYEREGRTLKLLSPSWWESKINLKTNEVYFGGGKEAVISTFEKPIPFNPKKDFLLIRSPNKKFNLENILTTMRLEEKLILGRWIVFNEKEVPFPMGGDSDKNPLFKSYYLGEFDSLISIYDSPEGIVLEYEKGRVPILKKRPDEQSWRFVGKGFRPFERFNFPEEISEFDPLKFNPSDYPKIKPSNRNSFYRKDAPKEDYSLVYINPEEITSKKWAFNSYMKSSLLGISKT